MPYAETSFFIAFMKPDDGHHEAALRLYKEHRGDIQTSLMAIAELLIGCEKRGTDAEAVVGSVFQIADVAGITLEEALKAAHFMKEEKLKAPDAIHCALAGKEIISSDRDIDRTGIKRIW